MEKYPQCTFTFMKYIWVRVDEDQLNVDHKNLPKQLFDDNDEE